MNATKSPFLLASNSDIEALMIAVRLESVVAKLLGRGADPGRGTADGKTPLSLAHEKGHETIARLLESAGKSGP